MWQKRLWEDGALTESPSSSGDSLWFLRTDSSTAPHFLAGGLARTSSPAAVHRCPAPLPPSSETQIIQSRRHGLTLLVLLLRPISLLAMIPAWIPGRARNA